MSWEGINWANEQRLKSPGQQLVLILLANWATQEGVIRQVRADRLVECSRQSRASVYRRLTELEEFGLLVRSMAGRSKDGSAVISGKLNFAMVYVNEKAEDCDEPEGQSQSETEGGQSQIETGGSLTGETGGSLTAETRYRMDSRESNSRESPTSSIVEFAGSGETKKKEENDILEEEKQTRVDTEFAAFRLAYPFRGEMDFDLAREEFAKLNVKDRAKAARCAAKYREACASANRRYPLDAARWLRKRAFDDIADMEQDHAERSGLKRPLVFVRFMTPAWDAWCAARKAAGKIPTSPLVVYSKEHRADGYWFETLYPPGHKPAA